jgi:hypothetical protein
LYDSIVRENDVTALDTATGLTELGSKSPGSVTVPAGARAITEIIISVGADYTADTLEGFTSAIHISGPGIKGNESWLGGPSAMVGGAAATSAALLLSRPQRVICNIPVNPGQDIDLEGFMHGSADPGSIRLLVQLVFDGPVVGRASYFDYREGDTAAANTPVSLAGRGGKTKNEFDVGPGLITDIIVNVGGVPVAGPLSAGMHFKLSGNGLVDSGNYDYLANSVSTQDDITISGEGAIVPGTHHQANIKTKKGKIDVQAQEIEDDIGTPSNIITLGFA